MFIVFPIYSISSISLLKRKVEEINNKLKNKSLKEKSNERQEFVPVSQEQEIQHSQQQSQVKQRVENTQQNSQFQSPHSLNYLTQFFSWYKDNWVLKTGVLLLVIAFGWFISYAFVIGLIGPIGKILTGFVIGISVILLGNYRMKKSIEQGASLVILAVAIILITIYGASFVYGMFTPAISLIATFLVAAYVNVVALRYNLKSMSIVGLFIAAGAPIFVGIENLNYLYLFLYLSVVTLAHIWIMFYKSWRIFSAISPLILAGYYIFYPYEFLLGSLEAYSGTILFLLLGMSLVFLISNIISIIKFNDDSSPSDGFSAIINGAFAIMVILFDPFINSLAATEGVQSLLISLLMIIFAVGSYIVFVKTKRMGFFYVYSLISIVYLAVVTGILLEGRVLILAYIFESAAISLVGYSVTSNLKVGYRLSLLMIFPGIAAIGSFSSILRRASIFNEDFAIIISMSFVLLGLGLFYLLTQKEEKPDYVLGVNLQPYSLMIIFGSLYIFGLVWVSLMSYFKTDQSLAVLFSLAIYTVIGLITYIYGKSDDKKIYRYYGSAVLIAVIVRLIFVDIWNMEIFFRAVTFAVIGIMLVGTAFIGKEHNKELPDNSNNR